MTSRMSRWRPFASLAEAPAESPCRAAFIGISHDHAWGEAEAIRRSPHMDLVGAFEPDAAEWERQRARAQFSDVRHLAARDVLEAPAIEVVFIETRPHDNLRWAREALVHDKQVHIDKAPAPSLNDLRGVLSLAADRGRHVPIGYQFR